MTLDDLKAYVIKAKMEYPRYGEIIVDLYELCLDEIEDGGSVEHEIASCIQSIDEITAAANNEE